MTARDRRMNWIRTIETPNGVVERRTIDVELASEANISGLLAYSGEVLLVAPLTFQADATGLHKYRMRMQIPATSYEFRPGSKDGYLFRDGPVGELVALFSLHFQTRFYVHSIVDGQLTPQSLASKTEYAPIRAALGRSIDPAVFDLRERTFAKGLAEFLDEVRRLPAKHHQQFILAADHYGRALREIGVDEEMVFVRLVSAVESMAGHEPIDADPLSGRNLEPLFRVEDLSPEAIEELKKTFDVRRSKARFLSFLDRNSVDFFPEQPTGPPRTQVTHANLRAVASAVSNARSNYLHKGDPMYLSRWVASFPRGTWIPQSACNWAIGLFVNRINSHARTSSTAL